MAAAPLAAWLLASSLAGSPAHAQLCSWSVDLPGAERRVLTLASDGRHGVLAVSWPTQWVDGPGLGGPGTLRLHHVLEHGVLDPVLPSSGVVFYTLADGDPLIGVMVMRVLPDGAGGAWVLAMHCDPFAPKLRAWETATFRLHHAAASGAIASGWVAGGLLIGAKRAPDFDDVVAIVPDGASGVITTWIAPTSSIDRTHVRSQRYAPDGTALWPGGTEGVMVSDSTTNWSRLRTAGDGSGGLGAVASRPLAGSDRDVRGFRVTPAGTLAWAQAGVPVYGVLGVTELGEAVAFESPGSMFVSFRSEMDPFTPGTTRLQRLGANGTMVYGTFALELGPTSDLVASLRPVPGAMFSMHAGAAGGSAMQSIDPSGYGYWGADLNGVPAPHDRASPVICDEGQPVLVWPDPASVYAGPATVIHALELGPDGEPAPGWPAAGVPLCSALYGHVLTDAMTPDGESVVVGLGTDYYSTVTPRISRLARAALDAPTGPPVATLAPPAASPNPSRSGWDVRFALPAACDVSLELIDVTGRLVVRAELGALPAGAHAHRLEGAALAPGVYRLRLKAGAAAVERRVIRVR